MTERARQQWIAGHASGLPAARVAVLLDRYGTVADDEDAPLAAAPSYTTGELRHLARTEDVVHLDDVLMRRTSLAFAGDATEGVAAEVAEAIAPVLGWRRAQIDAEVARGLARVNAADPTWDAASVSTVA